jgi:hypothetical protein
MRCAGGARRAQEQVRGARFGALLVTYDPLLRDGVSYFNYRFGGAPNGTGGSILQMAWNCGEDGIRSNAHGPEKGDGSRAT